MSKSLRCAILFDAVFYSQTHLILHKYLTSDKEIRSIFHVFDQKLVNLQNVRVYVHNA